METRGRRTAQPATPSIGDILQRVIRKEGLGKKGQQAQRLAQKALTEALGADQSRHVLVRSVKNGVAVAEVDSAALFQELVGYRSEEITAALRNAGLKVRELKVRLKQE